MRARFRIVSLRDIVSGLPGVNESQKEITNAMLMTPSAEMPTLIQTRLFLSHFGIEELPLFNLGHAASSKFRSLATHALWDDLVQNEIHAVALRAAIHALV